MDAVLNRKQRATPPVPRIFDGEKEARLIALACSQPPEGRAKWNAGLLETKVVELNIVDHASDNTIGCVLKKNALKPHLVRQWVIPPQASSSGDGGYSGRLRDGECPLVCLDETSKQPLADTRLPIAMKPGQLARRDYEYQRNGTAKFMIFAPLEAWRRVKVTDWRTAIDYAQALEDLSDRHFPNAKKIVLVQDNLNTHKPASLYEAFPAYKARRLVERFEWHYTPKHGSWLDMAESELAVLASQCLDRRIPDKHILIHQVAAWEADRNAHQAKADWQFTTDDARIKLKHLYPTF
jgi:hypothetical protein